MTKKRYIVRFARPMSRGEFRVIDTQQPVISQNYIVDRFMHCAGGREDAHDLAEMLNTATAGNPYSAARETILRGVSKARNQ